jgi:DNA-binding response OmpR family regulator
MKPAPATLLVVDDDEVVRGLIEEYFTQHGFSVRVAPDGAEARRELDACAPDLVFLDVGLPGEDGLSLARHIREHLDVPIIMVSGAGEPLDRIVGLEVGADDYVTKPFETRELLARVKSVLRRYRRGPGAPPAPGSARLQIPGFELDLDSRRVFRSSGEEVALTRLEFELLQALVERPNRVLSRDQLLNMTQNRDRDPFDRSIDIRIARLRRKLDAGDGGPELIRTVRGVGYMYAPGSR